MEFRYLGNSGLKISEITYGNWLTHGSQVENDAATACVRAALDAGISTFDTADVYANTKAETVLGEALAGERRESLEIFTKVYWPTGPGGKNDTGLSRKHIMESINGSLQRLRTDYVDLYQCHRYDPETPLEETMEALTEVVRQGKVRYIGFSEWSPKNIEDALSISGVEQFVSSQPQYSLLYRRPEAKVIPIAQWGAQRAYDYHTKKMRLLPRKQTWIRALPPMDLSRFGGRTDSAAARELTDEMMRTLADEVGRMRGEQPPATLHRHTGSS